MSEKVTVETRYLQRIDFEGTDAFIKSAGFGVSAKAIDYPVVINIEKLNRAKFRKCINDIADQIEKKTGIRPDSYSEGRLNNHCIPVQFYITSLS